MNIQIPAGPSHLDCPFHKKSMDKVCHKCPMWVMLRGKDPQSMKEIDSWNCSFAVTPVLLVENAQMSRQTAASVDSFRNRLVERVPLPTNHSLQLPPTEIMQIKGN